MSLFLSIYHRFDCIINYLFIYYLLVLLFQVNSYLFHHVIFKRTSPIKRTNQEGFEKDAKNIEKKVAQESENLKEQGKEKANELSAKGQEKANELSAKGQEFFDEASAKGKEF